MMCAPPLTRKTTQRNEVLQKRITKWNALHKDHLPFDSASNWADKSHLTEASPSFAHNTCAAVQQALVLR